MISPRPESVPNWEFSAWHSVLSALHPNAIEKPGHAIGNELRRSLTMIHVEKHAMIAHSTFQQPLKGKGLAAIAVGGLLAGILDLTQAFILFGWRVPLVVAGGLLGRQAVHGGPGTYVLGVFLHFCIALSVAAIYYLASRRLSFLKEHPLVCGLFYGAAVELVMNLIVLPLSALHARGPYKLHDLLQGLIAHMILIGLPISFSIRRFAK